MPPPHPALARERWPRARCGVNVRTSKPQLQRARERSTAASRRGLETTQSPSGVVRHPEFSSASRRPSARGLAAPVHRAARTLPSLAARPGRASRSFERVHSIGESPRSIHGCRRRNSPLTGPASRSVATRGSSRASRALAPATNEALLDERLQRIEVRIADVLRSDQREAADEDGEAPEDLLLLGRKEVVAPLDRRAQRLLPRVGVAASRQRSRRWRALEDLLRGERPRARGGQLDREREVVETAAELGDASSGSKSPSCAGASLKSSTASASRSGGTGYSSSPGRAGAPAGHEHVRLGQARNQPPTSERRLDHLLEVVDQEQQLPLGDVLGEPVLTPSVCAIAR